MKKDPAFLFYSKDFYESTRIMLPEERAAFIDLLIYQHRHGYIPNDLKRLEMYCSGVPQAMLKATLEAKFKLCDKGWYNSFQEGVLEKRKNFSNKQSINGSVGQFWKRVKKLLPAKKYNDIKASAQKEMSNEEVFHLLGMDEGIHEATLEAMLEALRKHLVNVNVNKEDKGGVGEKEEKEKPLCTEEEFINFALEKEPKLDIDYVKWKYRAWNEEGWVDGKGNKIKRWKGKVTMNIPHWKVSDKPTKEELQTKEERRRKADNYFV